MVRYSIVEKILAHNLFQAEFQPNSSIMLYRYATIGINNSSIELVCN